MNTHASRSSPPLQNTSNKTPSCVPVLEHSPCMLGEGPLWHPVANALIWFDIIGRTLFVWRESEPLRTWPLKRMSSAAGWIDQHTLLIADEIGLSLFSLIDGNLTHIVGVEEDNTSTRSNDGRADPWGGFWMSTMGKKAEHQAGNIYRYYRGDLRLVIPRITIPNALCVCEITHSLYYADTSLGTIWRQQLRGEDGWPSDTPPTVFVKGQLDIGGRSLGGCNPDGAVTDAQGNLWCAQWGLACVTRFTREGVLIDHIPVDTDNVTCPAFGGKNGNTLFITSAQQGLTQQQLSQQPHAGQTFALPLSSREWSQRLVSPHAPRYESHVVL